GAGQYHFLKDCGSRSSLAQETLQALPRLRRGIILPAVSGSYSFPSVAVFLQQSGVTLMQAMKIVSREYYLILVAQERAKLVLLLSLRGVARPVNVALVFKSKEDT